MESLLANRRPTNNFKLITNLLTFVKFGLSLLVALVDGS